MLFLYLFILVLTFLLCYAIVMLSTYICHKKVSVSYKESFRRRTFYGDSAGTERISYIADNTEALLYRLNMIENAKTSIILSTFDFNTDHAGKDVLAALLQAADRGVEVKVIADGISGYLDLRNNPYFQVFAAHKNVSVKVYNPLDFFKPWRLPARLHDKYLIIDHRMYLLGGRNTSDLFLGNYSERKNIDREAFVYETSTANESSINQLIEYFESVWALRGSKKYLCKEKQKFEDVLLWLKNHYKQLRNRYPQAYEKWDYTALTMPACKISLLSNPIQAENKEPWLCYSLFEILKT